MIEEVVSVELPVHERLVVRKNRLMNKDENHSTPRISIVTGTHGDELDGQLICYEIIRRIERWLNMWQQALLKILLEVICVLISIQVIYL